MKRVLGALLLSAVALFPVASASAQSVNCTTFFGNTSMPMTDCNGPSGLTNCTTFFANSSMPMTDCNGPSGSVNCTSYFADTTMPMTDCSGPGLSSRPAAPPPAYVLPPAPGAPSTPPDPGLYFVAKNGTVQYAPLGTFEKEVDAPAIYVVAYGQLHAFSTWSQFLRWGGHADLSNVQLYSHIDRSLIGQPARD